VFLQRPEERANLAYTSESATADVVLDGRNVTVAPAARGFDVVVSRNGTVLAAAAMPAPGSNATVAGITFEREGRQVYAVVDDTRVQVFTREKYR
jgi:hypothetical protein